jgi:hypothetical protein
MLVARSGRTYGAVSDRLIDLAADMSDMADRPTLRGFLKAVWPVLSGHTKRELKTMGGVWRELMRVVYSHLADDEAALGIGELVRSDRRGAEATLRWVRHIRHHSHTYETDRAYRILVAAMQGTSPEPIRPEDAHLFERERNLGWMPLGEAFDHLAAAVPELDEVRARAQELAADPQSFGITQDDNEIVFPAGVRSGVTADALRLVGPDSRHPDSLIRSPVAATVVANYVTAVLTHTTDRALWDYEKPRLRTRSDGTFFEFG